MVSQRILLLGLVLLFLGIQFRLVKSFELNGPATQFVEKRFPSEQAKAQTSYVSYDLYGDPLLAPIDAPAAPSLRTITPPRWLGLKFIAVGAVLVLTSPCFKS